MEIMVYAGGVENKVRVGGHRVKGAQDDRDDDGVSVSLKVIQYTFEAMARRLRVE